MSKDYKVAVCGLGWWGSKILRNCANHPSISFVAACDPDCDKRSEMESEFGVTGYESLEAALNENELDAVFVITPPETHFDLVKSALTKGLHVVVAKPPTLALAETAELANIARERGLTLMTDATFCYSPPFTKIKELLDSGLLGQVRHVESIRSGDNLRVQGRHRLEYAMRDTGTNVIQDLVMHDLAILANLFGDAFSVKSVLKTDTLFEGLCDTAHISLQGDDIAAQIDVSWILPQRARRLTICGEKAILVWDDLSQEMRLWSMDTNGDNETIYELGDTEPLYAMLNHFLSCIESGEQPATGPDLMETAMKLFKQIEEL